MLRAVNPRMKKWDLSANEPVSLELEMLKTLDQMQKERERKELFDSIKLLNDEAKIHEEEMNKLREICQNYGINTSVLETEKFKNNKMKLLQDLV